MSARRRGLVPRLLVLVAVVLAALALAELGARVLVASERFAWRPLVPFGCGAIRDAWLERAERELAGGPPPPGYSRFDPDLGWSTRPGYASSDGAVHVNARGLRATREYAETAPEGVRRVIACGESFTFCEEVADADAWPARLEALEPGLEVLNYGVGGYGTDQALLRASREARGPLEAVLVGLMLENIGRNVNRYRPLWYPSAQPAAKPRYVLRPGGLELVAQPFGTLAELVAAVRSGEVFARLAEHEHWRASPLPAWLEGSAAARLLGSKSAYAARALEPLWQDAGGDPFRTTLALLDAFRTLARSLGGARFLVLLFPTREDLAGLVEREHRYWSVLLAALAAHGIEALDLSEPLAAAAREPGGEAPLYLSSHLSPRGNELVAAALAAWLAQARASAVPK
jgi:hypothetical protein